MDIKRKLSPHLGDDLKIRIYFGEIQNFYPSSSSVPVSPLPANSNEGLELVPDHPTQSYRKVLSDEEKCE